MPIERPDQKRLRFLGDDEISDIAYPTLATTSANFIRLPIFFSAQAEYFLLRERDG